MDRQNLSVLVVDDDEPTRYAVARTLRAAGYKTMEAVSGAEALEFSEYVSAVVLDIHLPDLLGWEVCRLLRNKPSTAHLPVIHVSARYTTAEDQAQSVQSGADGYLVSPLDPVAFVDLVDRLILERSAGS